MIGAAVCAAVGLLYSTTLQTDINGLDDLVDVGEFQNALYLWGIVHPTGYPLYLLVGGAFVHFLHFAGVNPAAGASLFSLAGAVAALATFFAALFVQTRQSRLAAAFTLLLASVSAFWMRSIDAEVYTWAFFFIALVLALAIALRSRPGAPLLLGLAFALGTGVAHHRLVGLILPGLVIWIAPEAWRLIRLDRRLILFGLVCFSLPFFVYLYLPLRALVGTYWEFAEADTWTGFWNLFTGRGYLSEGIAIPAGAAALASSFLRVLSIVVEQLTPVGLAAAVLALLALWIAPGTRRLAAFVTAGLGTWFAFALIYPIRDIDAYLVPVTMLFLLTAAAAVGELSKLRPRLPSFAAALALCLAAFIGLHTYPAAYQVGSDRSGRELLDAVQPLSGPQAVLVGPWGPDFFDFWYGKYVTGEIAPPTQVVTPDAPFRRLLNQGFRLYASKDIFYSMPLEEWDRRLGRVHIQSAGHNVVEISNRPMPQQGFESARGEATFGSLVTLLNEQNSVDRSRGVLNLTLYWRAEQAVGADYSVMVHLVDRTEGDRVIAEADSAHPVYGFYPTSRWQKDEIVRDDYQMTFSRGLALDHADLIVGWYRLDIGTSTFQNLGTFRISPPELKTDR